MAESQLTTEFRRAVEEAIAQPEAASLKQLWQYAEQQLAKMEQEERLRAAGDAIAQLCDVHVSRAECLLGSWEQRWRDRIDTELDTEPVLTEEMLSSFLRQTMSLGLEEMLDHFLQTRSRDATEPENSVVGEVEKEALLNWLDQDEYDKALSVAHEENVSDWVRLIQNWLESHGQAACFRDLAYGLQQQHPGTTWAATWLGLLLGDFILQPSEYFYDADFIVRLPPSSSLSPPPSLRGHG